MADADPIIGGSFMPYPVSVKDPALLNYRAATGRGDDANTFSSNVHGDPATPLLRAYAGDPTKVHFLVAPGSEQMHVFGLGGQYWPFDPEIAASQSIASQGVGPWETFDAELAGGAGGLARTRGDFFYGDVRRPFTQAGMWGLMRVMSDASCPIKPLDGLTCKGQDSIIFDPPADLPRPGDPAPGGSGSGGGGSSMSGGGSPSSAGTTAQASGSSRAARNLKIPSSVKLRAFGLKGLGIALDVPSDARVLDLQLMRRTGGRLKRMLTGSVKIAKLCRDGHVTLTWKPGRKRVAKLLAGKHVLRVRVGPDRRRLSDTVSAPVRLVGPRLRAAAARRR